MLRTRTDVEYLLSLARRFCGLGRASLSLSMSALTFEEQQRYALRINTALRECGCLHGAVVSIAAALAVGIVCFRRAEDLGLGVYMYATLSVLIALALGGLLGKLAGLALANLRLRRTLHELLNRAR